MIFVIGGAYQGKKEFVKKEFHINEQEILDGEYCNYEELLQAKAICGLERLIYRRMKEEIDVYTFIDTWLKENKDLIIICNEIGSGLVPVDAFERKYREMVGRIGCLVAGYAKEVYRVQYGIATKIKENKKNDQEIKESAIIKVYLIRHSITKGNLEKRFIGSTDESLCEEGIALAKEKKLPFVCKVYVSPLKRCQETANILYPNHETAVISGLRETDFGDFEYKNYEELKGNKDYQKWIDSNAMSGFPNGESMEDTNRRVEDTFLHIIKDAVKHQYDSIAIVTHGGTIMSIMTLFAKEKRSYHDWLAKNCEGFLLEIDGGSACYQ
ncbi:bifunctional adenosylcobinamide kinase/adenosylcobinamide-phosphate guanylyltransferase [Candidatus Galacturonibacter soehngenii]|uniref:Adenosylcobinamide-phosphate guanylyltransferase n=1 Tax=Candidatus Galacturonatibacter soehngenii TaxID=2307010 RepID=A0A7V7UCZ9_9FIRM|nr:bifunctional adenosylcobinamide kinase/adenosylcobinamide-phosphate guanylyltransferase [Candidatus Galacturonibacter soehngenii]KAB1439892.1 hypothetical protein F7O84_05780 [Candidatus Galacturonibacter soehngenii]